MCLLEEIGLLTADIAVKLRIPRFLFQCFIDSPSCSSYGFEFLCRQGPRYLSGLLLLLGERLALTLGYLRCNGVRSEVWLVNLARLIDETMGRGLNVCAW